MARGHAEAQSPAHQAALSAPAQLPWSQGLRQAEPRGSVHSPDPLLLLRVQNNLLSASPKHARSHPCPAAPRHFSRAWRCPLSQMLPLRGPGLAAARRRLSVQCGPRRDVFPCQVIGTTSHQNTPNMSQFTGETSSVLKPQVTCSSATVCLSHC